MRKIEWKLLYLYNSYFTNESHKKGKFSNLRNFEWSTYYSNFFLNDSNLTKLLYHLNSVE